MLAGIAAVLLVLCLAPPKLTRWLEWFRDPLVVVVTPAARPASMISSWLRPGSAPVPRDEELSADDALRQRDELNTMYLQALRENEALRATIRDLQNGREFASDPSCESFVAPRVGRDLNAGTIEVRGGAADEITEGSVAVSAGGQQLIGIVTAVGRLTSTVRAVTHTSGENAAIETLLVPPGVTDPGAILGAPRCRLEPVGDGTLIGEIGVESPDDEQIAPGLLARLDDPTWPACASRLIVGRIIEVRRTDHPLHRRIVVQPEIDPMHAPSVVLRIPQPDGARDGGGGEGAP